MKKHNADDVKLLLLDRFSNFFDNWIGAAHEVTNLNSADVIAVNRSGMKEFEIKVSRADLVGEMRCARVAMGLDHGSKYLTKQVRMNLDKPEVDSEAIKEMAHENSMGTALSRTKLEKHQLYLQPQPKPDDEDPKLFMERYEYHRKFIPNHFYWAIPHELLTVCTDMNEGLPYGIYVFDKPLEKNTYSSTYIHKSPRPLEARLSGAYYELFNRASTLWRFDRDELARLKEDVDEKAS